MLSSSATNRISAASLEISIEQHNVLHEQWGAFVAILDTEFFITVFGCPLFSVALHIVVVVVHTVELVYGYGAIITYFADFCRRVKKTDSA